MPQLHKAPYKMARQERLKDYPAPPASGPKLLAPENLLKNENRFDPNTYAPSGILRKPNGSPNPDATLTTT